MPDNRSNSPDGNLLRNIIIGIIAILITLYFYYRPFRNDYPSLVRTNPYSVFNDVDKGKLSNRNQPDSNPLESEKDYDLLYLMGMKFYSEGNLDFAAEQFEKAKEIKISDDLNQTLQQIYKKLAVKKINEGELDKARDFYDKAIEITPLKNLIIQKANTYVLSQDLDNALSLMEQYKPNFGSDADYMVSLSNLLYDDGQFSAAYENMVNVLDKDEFNPSAQMLRERMEDEYSVKSENAERGKQIVLLISKTDNGRLLENFIYSIAGKVSTLFSTVYGIGIKKKVNLYISKSESDSLPLKPGYDTSAINTIYIPMDSIRKKINDYQKSITFFISSKVISDDANTGNPNLLHTGISLKMCNYSMWGKKSNELFSLINRRSMEKALDMTVWPETEKEKEIFRILSVSFIDFLASEFSISVISEIIKREREGVSLKNAFVEISEKDLNVTLNKWQYYFNSRIGKR